MIRKRALEEEAERVRRRDDDAVEAEAQAIYRAAGETAARQAFASFRLYWQGVYGAMVRRLERDLPERLSFFCFPWHLRKQLRTTHPSAEGLLRRGGATADPARGLLRQRRERGPDHLVLRYRRKWNR